MIAGTPHRGIIRTEVIGHLTVTEVLYEPRVRLRTHFHELACLCYTLEGAYTETIGTRSFDCAPLQILYRPSGRDHSDSFRNRYTRCLLVEFGSEYNAHRELREDCAFPTSFSGSLTAQRVFRLRKEWISRDSARAIAIESLAMELLVDVVRERKRPVSTEKRPQWLTRAKDILDQEPQTITRLGDLAGLVGVHPTHLARAFRRHFNCSVGDYLRRQRMHSVCEALQTTSRPLAQIALAAGYADQSHLTRSFTKALGMTPGEFRRTQWQGRRALRARDTGEGIE